ncbi:MAG: ECF transporter S component [Actinobacteria bacterium]|nr:ECF transporter S component [Actinomycetota bacterium]
MRFVKYALLALAGLLVYLGIAGIAPFVNWSMNSLFLAVIILAVLFLRYEEGEFGSREVAVVGALAAVAAAGRVLFAAVPSVQPATFIIILAGYVFGSEPGFMVGALTALLSNIFLGQGPWTPWQMLAWGLAGASGGVLAAVLKKRVRIMPIAALCTVWGFLFGWMMNFWFWLSFVYPLTLRSFMTANLTSFWFDLFHAVGNLLFAIFLTTPVATMLLRFRERFAVEYMAESEPDAHRPLLSDTGGDDIVEA